MTTPRSSLLSRWEVDIVPGIGGLPLVQNIIRTLPAPRRLRHAARTVSRHVGSAILLSAISKDRARVARITVTSRRGSSNREWLCSTLLYFRYLERLEKSNPDSPVYPTFSLKDNGKHSTRFFSTIRCRRVGEVDKKKLETRVEKHRNARCQEMCIPKLKLRVAGEIMRTIHLACTYL